MAQSNPVAPAALFVLRAGNGDPVTTPLPVAEAVTQPPRITGGGTEETTGSATGSERGAEVTPLPVPLTPAERAHLAAKHWAELAANGAGQMFFHPDRIGHFLYHGHPGSLAEHRAYIKSREWVPPDLDGKGAKVIGGSGVVYHLLIARPLKAACLIVSAAADKPLRLIGLIAFVLVFIIAVVPHIPLI